MKMKRARISTVIAAVLLSALFRCPLNGADVFQEVTVHPGDTLWGISQYYLKDPKRWPELLKYNSSLNRDPTVALPGMKLRIPILLIKENLRAAELVRLLNDVRYRRKQSNLWQKASLNMQLYNEDGLRTMESSAADIKFPTGETVKVEANSFAIVRPERGNDTVELMSGDVRARQARVITAGGADVTPQGNDADYRTRVKTDKSELVLVYRGRVNVTAQGKTVQVLEGFGTEIRPLSPPTEPVSLPKIPAISFGDVPSPEGIKVKPVKTERGTMISVDVPALKDLRPEQTLSPGTKAQAVRPQQYLEKYHLEVDDTIDFKTPLVGKTFPLSQKMNLNQLGLPNGSYWWRIAFVDSLGMEGNFSQPQAFEVDLTPPSCTISSPDEGEEIPWEKEYINVTGHAETGVRISVEDEPAEIDMDGRFSAKIALHEGKNRIILTAKDASGNVTNIERVVYRLALGQEGKFQVARKERKEKLEGEQEGKGSMLATVGIGMATIGTIIGIFLLIL